MSGWLNSLLAWDRKAEHLVNVTWKHPVLDLVAPVLRNQYTWIPLYVFLAIFIPRKYGKKGWLWCLGFLITFALSDYTSASLIKPYVQRLRPCNDAVMRHGMRLLVDCGSGYSFPSSHAANHFALAVFMSFTLRKSYRWIWVASLLWAFSVAYAQVYVGVHYPLDVLCGGLLGCLAGFITGRFFETKIGLSVAKR